MAKMKPDPALTERLRRICARFPDRAVAAEAAGVTLGQIRHYLSDGQRPNLTIAARLCQAAGVSLEWLALGTGDPDPAKNPVRSEQERACLAAAIAMVDATLAATEHSLDSDAKAALVLAALDLERDTSREAAGKHLARIIQALHQIPSSNPRMAATDSLRS